MSFHGKVQGVVLGSFDMRIGCGMKRTYVLYMSYHVWLIVMDLEYFNLWLRRIYVTPRLEVVKP